jgi:hypothetical protein
MVRNVRGLRCVPRVVTACCFFLLTARDDEIENGQSEKLPVRFWRLIQPCRMDPFASTCDDILTHYAYLPQVFSN